MSGTLPLLLSTAIDPSKGYAQPPGDALDLDGFKEVGLFFRADNWNSGSSTLNVTIAHAARNGDADRLPLVTIPITGASTYSYQSSFLRFLSAKLEWSTPAPSTNGATVEILTCPKN